LPAHPWIRQIDADIRRRERTTGRTFSRRS